MKDQVSFLVAADTLWAALPPMHRDGYSQFDRQRNETLLSIMSSEELSSKADPVFSKESNVSDNQDDDESKSATASPKKVPKSPIVIKRSKKVFRKSPTRPLKVKSGRRVNGWNLFLKHGGKGANEDAASIWKRYTKKEKEAFIANYS